MRLKYLRTLQKLVCTLVYELRVQINDQISILRNWSKVILRHALSLRLHLKGVIISWNVTKVGVYASLLKWVPKSTFKFQFLKSQKKCIFSTLVWPSLVKGQNSSKYHRNRCQFLYLKWVSKSTLKFEFWEIRNNATF